MTEPTVSLHGQWICPFATRVAFALAQREIDHDEVDVPPSAVRGPDFVLPPEFVGRFEAFRRKQRASA